MSDAAQALKAADPKLARVIELIGPLDTERSPVDFHTMVGVIVGQQLSGKAAETIRRRLCLGVGCPEEDRVDPAMFEGYDPEGLRPFGLSRQKASYILDLAARTGSGEILFDRFDALPDEEIIRELTSVKGIGVWTVQMILMFSLGREDVLPVDDLGIQHGMRILDGLPERPKKAYMEQRAEIWRPYRSLASRYLWKVKDDLGELP